MTHSDDGNIIVERFGHVLAMGLNRPHKYNGLTPHMFDELRAAYEQLDEDPELRVGVLHALGDHFTAGLDLPKFAGRFASGEDFSGSEGIDLYNRFGRRLTKPLITAVKGITFTAGIELMLAGDIVIAASDCRFAQLEPKRGLMASGGATYRFVERGGWGNAMKWLLTGDEFDADEALRIGIIQEIVTPGEELRRALELAQIIAERAPLAVQATLLNARTYALHGEETASAEFMDIQARMAASEDFQEGVQSFIEKRPAQFKGR